MYWKTEATSFFEYLCCLLCDHVCGINCLSLRENNHAFVHIGFLILCKNCNLALCKDLLLSFLKCKIASLYIAHTFCQVPLDLKKLRKGAEIILNAIRGVVVREVQSLDIS